MPHSFWYLNKKEAQIILVGFLLGIIFTLISLAVTNQLISNPEFESGLILEEEDLAFPESEMTDVENEDLNSF